MTTVYYCRECAGVIEFFDSPHGSWWAHAEHPHAKDDHDAIPWKRGDQIGPAHDQDNLR